MNSYSVQEARDLIGFAIQTVERLARAAARFDLTHDEPADERGWLSSAAERVNDGLFGTQTALHDAAALPEFASARKIKSDALSNIWADAVESVFDGVVANVSANGPLIEALFPHQRFAILRRPGAQAQNYWLEFERRAESSYVRRLCTDPEYAFLAPLLETAKTSERSLRESLAPRPLHEARAEQLREQVSAAAERLELALRQARSLCDAVFAATPSVVAELGLDAKPKRRTPRSARPAAEPATPQEASDPIPSE